MSLRGEFVSTEEAARILGVTVQHVRRLVDSGELTRIARGLIDRSSVERYLTERQGGRTRAWAEHTAWGAIALLSGNTPAWLGPVQASRLRSALRDITDPADILARTRDRAKVHTFTAHPAAVTRLMDSMAVTDHAALGLAIGPGEPGAAEGYLAADTLDATVRSLGLRNDPDGDVVIRSTGFDFDVVTDLASRSVTLAALDAAASLDPRVRGVGQRALAEILEGYRR
ncbi:helix-turn-helix domain-containing protein [Phytoactinopolyspora mesophila]|uniref:Helix-turn-helix domain-containing protein n=1 Tax=Phytoactinopolyspora mesophila TaxID=2650750 RepID=A0A7K3M5M7_9ACTN|nr:helix-turn-helix domain-containing protein [Phytoactinopolyspora mesophila]NDL58327.1 helix-turn-helix domain-containing protein [Phytoactinopolyspora mesophila]